MSAPAPVRGPRRDLIFISFRSADAGSYAAVYLDEVLPRVFGRDHVFRSSRSIPVGADFPEVLLDALSRTRVLVVLIGRDWATVAGADGTPMLHRAHDWVRTEIAESLRSGVLVIPVLLTGAAAPTREQLPADIADLADRQMVYLRHRHVDPDAGYLVAQIKKAAPDLVVMSKPGPGRSARLGATISERQNTNDMIDLLRASTTANRRLLHVDAAISVLSLAVALAGAFGTFAAPIAVPATVAGGIWAVFLAAGLNPWSTWQARRAAVVQEMFDTETLGIPWNVALVGAPVSGHEIRRQAASYPAPQAQHSLRDWYVDTTGLPYPIDVLVCQQQNLGWDVRLRRRWALLIGVAILTWLVIGVVASNLAGLTILQSMLRWYVPSIGALLLGLKHCRAQLEICDERARVLRLAESEIAHARPAELDTAEIGRIVGVARGIQDVIFGTRTSASHVPGWFYARFRDVDERDFQSISDALRRSFPAVD